jgi:hypothetical protein
MQGTEGLDNTGEMGCGSTNKLQFPENARIRENENGQFIIMTPQHMLHHSNLKHLVSSNSRNSSVIRQDANICVRVLNHASSCTNARCGGPACQKMKEVIKHFKNCPTKSGCQKCKKFMTLCFLHGKECHSSRCSVPHCDKIKLKIKQLSRSPKSSN